MNACEAVQELLLARLLAALDPSEGTLVQEHLGACDACREAELEAQASLALVVAPPLEPPPEVWARLQERLARTQADDPVRDVDAEVAISLACSYCRGVLARATAVYCASCLAPHHGECFAEHGRCSVMGCGERKVVRPAALLARALEPAPEAQPAPAPAARPERPERRGLVARLRRLLQHPAAIAACLLAVAATTTLALWPADLPPSHHAHPAFELQDQRFRIEVQQATLGELAAELERRAGLSLEVPPDALHLVVPHRRTWDRVAWPEAVAELAAGLELRLEARGEGRAALVVDVPEHARRLRGPAAAPDKVELDALLLVGLDDSPPAELTRGRDLALTCAPEGEGLAVLEDGLVEVYRGDEKLGDRRLPRAVRGGTIRESLTWSSDGDALACAFDVVLVGDPLTQELPSARASDATGRLLLFSLGARPPRAWREIKDLPMLAMAEPPAWPGVCFLEPLEAERGAPPLILQAQTRLVRVSQQAGAPLLPIEWPDGERRGPAPCMIAPLSGGRFLLASASWLEVWRSGPKAERLARRGFAASSTVQVAGDRALVVGPQECSVLDLRDAARIEVVTTEQRRQRGSAPWTASLSRTGQHLAFRDGNQHFVRRLDAPAGVGLYELSPPLRERQVQWFDVAWGPGELLAWWGAEACYVFDVARHPFDGVAGVQAPMRRVLGAEKDLTLRAVGWAGRRLAVVRRSLVPRAPVLLVRRVE